MVHGPGVSLSSTKQDCHFGNEQETTMFQRKTIVLSIISGVMLVASASITPASAKDYRSAIEIGLDRLLDDRQIGADNYYDGKIHKVHSYERPRRSELREAPRRDRYRDWQDNQVGYNDVPIRRIHRKLRKRGLTPVSDYRLKGNSVILRAENRRGAIYKIVASARSGNIRNLRLIHNPRYREPDYWFDGGYSTNNQTGWDRPYRSRSDYDRPKYKKRDHNKKKVVKRKKLKQLEKKKIRQVRRVERKPYIDQSEDPYEIWKYGSPK